MSHAPSEPKTTLRLGLSVAVAAWIVGIFIIFFTHESLGGIAHDGYYEIATNLASGNGYRFAPDAPPVLHRPPAYAFVITPIMWLPKHAHAIGVVGINSLFLALSVGIVFHEVKRLIGQAQAYATIMLMLANASLWWTLKNPMSALMQMALYTVLLSLFLQLWREQKGYLPVILWGLIGALATLTHGTMGYLVAVLSACLCARYLYLRHYANVQKLVLALLLMALCLSPWLLRNYHCYKGEAFPITGNFGIAYFAGYWHWEAQPDALEQGVVRLAKIHQTDAAQDWAFSGVTRPELDLALSRQAKAHMLEHPRALAKKTFLNALEYYFPSVHDLILGRPLNALRLFTSVYYLGLWLLIALALQRCQSSERRIIALSLVFAALYALPYFPLLTYVGHSLYTFGTLPLLCASAAFALFPRRYERVAV